MLNFIKRNAKSIGLIMGSGIVGGIVTTAMISDGAASLDCPPQREDVNCDYRVNSLDLWAVANKFGMIITPEAPSPTATSTAVPVPTRTPTPQAGGELNSIIAGLTGNNPACVEGTEGFDWGGLLPFTGVEKNGPINRNRNIPPSGASRLTVWLMMNHQANCNSGTEVSPTTNGQINISNMKVWVLLNTGEWRALDSRIWGWQDNEPFYGGLNPTIYDSACCFNANPPYTVPHNRGKQAYTAQNTMPFGVIVFLTTYKARSTGGLLMVNCGADYYSSTGGYMGDLYVGKFIALEATDKLVSCTNLSGAQLRSNPPPSF